MTQSCSTIRFSEELEYGSEEISFSEAEYKLVGKFFVDCVPVENVTKLYRHSKGEPVLVTEEKDENYQPFWCVKKVSTSGKVLTDFRSFLSEPEVAVVSTDEYFVANCEGVYYCHGNGDRQHVDNFTKGITCSCLGYVDDHLFYVRHNKEMVIKVFKGKPRSRISQTHVSIALNHSSKAKLYVSAVKEYDTGVIYVCGPASLNCNQITKLSLTGEVMMVYNDWKFPASAPIAAASDGHLFVCFERHLQIIMPEMDRAVHVLVSNGDIGSPIAMCYCSEERKLYMCGKWSKEIMVISIN